MEWLRQRVAGLARVCREYVDPCNCRRLRAARAVGDRRDVVPGDDPFRRFFARSPAPLVAFLNPMLGYPTDTASGKIAGHSAGHRHGLEHDFSVRGSQGASSLVGPAARNIANADTPGYAPRDLEPLRFRDMVHRSTPSVQVAKTVSGHLGGGERPAAEFVERERRDAADATPAGNAVDLEEEMAKIRSQSGCDPRDQGNAAGYDRRAALRP